MANLTGRGPMGQKSGKVRSNALRGSAHGEQCTLRLPGICNHNPETTVLAHVRGHLGGMATKESDIHGVFACSDCHAAIDTLTYRGVLDREEVLDAIIRAISETQARWITLGLITVKD